MTLPRHVLENTKDGEPTVSLHCPPDKEIFPKSSLNLSSHSLWLLPFTVSSATTKEVGSIIFVTLLHGVVGCY